MPHITIYIQTYIKDTFPFESPFHSFTLKFYFPEVKKKKKKKKPKNKQTKPTYCVYFSVIKGLYVSIFFPNEMYRSLNSLVFT